MRKLAATFLALLAVGAAGCGSGGSSGGGKDPLDEALGYLPKTAPLVIAVDTDLNGSQWKSLAAIGRKFSFGSRIGDQLKQAISKQGLDFDKQIRPLLGNQAVIGAPDARSITRNGNGFVVALKVKDKGKLSSLLKQSKDLMSDGSSNGATLYRQTDGGETGQAGDVLIASDTKAHLIEALQQHKRGDRLREDQFDSALSDLPKSAVVRVYADLQALIDQSPSTAQARKIKWISALRTLGLTGSATSSAISFDLNVKTDPSGLTDADVPIATGDASPGVSGKAGELAFGLRGVNQVITFAEAAAQAVSPGSYGDFLRSKAQVGQRLGIDVDRDVIGQLSGSTTVSVDLNGGYAIRSELKNPAAFAKTLAKLSRVAPSFAGGIGLRGAHLSRSHGLYKLSGRGGKTVYFGVVGKVFVLATDPARIGQLAAAAPRSVPGAKGAFVTSSDAGAIFAKLVSGLAGSGLGGGLGGAIASAPLGNLDGWVSASTSGLKGHLQLGIK